MLNPSGRFKYRPQAQKDLDPDGLETWRLILSQHERAKRDLIHPLFSKGVDLLGLSPDNAPNLQEVNRRLKALTGFEGVCVEGFEEAEVFYLMLADKKFPIGNFIRNKNDLSYTPAPDIVHDLYGHLPFLADPDYAEFCYQVGRLGCEILDSPEKVLELQRFFWFTGEFGLVKTNLGLKVFGAGIASSISECEYALSAVPKHLPFDIETIRNQDFRIDEMQKILFVLENETQLYESIPELSRQIKG